LLREEYGLGWPVAVRRVRPTPIHPCISIPTQIKKSQQAELLRLPSDLIFIERPFGSNRKKSGILLSADDARFVHLRPVLVYSSGSIYLVHQFIQTSSFYAKTRLFGTIANPNRTYIEEQSHGA
jgi:hypothetical protein